MHKVTAKEDTALKIFGKLGVSLRNDRYFDRVVLRKRKRRKVENVYFNNVGARRLLDPCVSLDIKTPLTKGDNC